MEYDEDTQVLNFVTGLLLGAAIGAGVALLTAPEPGRRTRRRIRRKADDLRDTATDRWEGVAEDVRGKVDDAIRGARKRFVP
jgi:gas vesicle protein